MDKYSQLLSREALMDKKLFWDVSDIAHLSDQAIVERILNYGDMTQFRAITKDKIAFTKIYKQLIEKKRINLFPRVVNFVNLYLRNEA